MKLVLEDDQWDAVIKATELIQKGEARKIEGENWKAYRVAATIRIDIQTQGE